MSNPYQIRSVLPGDLPMLLSWRNHPSVRKYMFTQHKITSKEHLDWYERIQQDTSYCLLIVESDQGPIGYVQFKNAIAGGVSEWGFYVKPDSPKGSGNKVGNAALEHAFTKLKIHKVCGLAIDKNLASISLHKRLGFLNEGILRSHQLIDGEYFNVFYFGLLSHEWEMNI